MITKIIEFSTRNPFIIFTLVFFALAGSYYAIRNIPLDAIPDLSDVQVIIFTEWKGRSPDLVEDQVTYPIVTAMIAAPKAKVVRGYSFFGLSFVYVLFEDGTDIYWARSRTLEYLDKVTGNLPPGVTPVIGPDATGVGWGFEYALVDESGQHDLAELRSFQDWYFRYWLESVPGVAEVASLGGFVKQYQVILDPNKLLAFNIPVSRVVESIRTSNNDVGGRTIEFSGKEYMVRGRGYIRSLKDLESIVVDVNPKTGAPVLLRDIASIKLGPDIRRGIAELNGQGEVVSGIVVVRYGQNVLNVIDRVKKKIKEVEPALPKGVKVVTTYDRSDLILRSIDTLKHTLIEEMIVVSLVILIFLLHFRSSLVAIITLPIAVAVSFIPMFYLKLNSNIMSLGGIAIAIGAMVDAAVVLIENAHKHVERSRGSGDRLEIIIRAAKEVGPPIFFSLLVLTIAFLPVFTLEAQEGRLFKPLAFTKTFAMFFAAILSITLAPALMRFFIRGTIIAEEKNPISRFLIWLYRPFVNIALRYRWLTLGFTLLILISTWPVFRKLGSEFMPPLNEGTILYMPVTLPGNSITEAGKILQLQDKILMQFPEVEQVFGKIGRSRTSTDPAPLEMVETVINLKPKEKWRPGMTWDKLIGEMDQATRRIPGITNAWTMPIKARIDMLSTGIRTPIGIKVFGPDLKVIQHLGEQLEEILTPIRGTRSVYAERVTGGYFLDIEPKREEISRFGLTVEEVLAIVETAIGGMNIDVTIEGRERYPVNVRYGRELREDLDKLQRVLVPTPVGAQVPLGQLATITKTIGPPSIKDEDGSLVGYVYVDIVNRDIGSWVNEAKRVVNEKLTLPPGYYLSWTGQYEYMLRIKERLKLIIPITLILIIILLYMNFKNITETFIVILSVPFALVGSIWFLYLLHYNLSIAVWVGIIALGGIAAETGVVMIIYLDESYQRARREGRLKSLQDLTQAVIEGSVMRVRPKMMTVTTTIIGLVPLLWSTGTGADVMRRIAAPMIGGLISSTVLTLIIIPSIYLIWKSVEMSHFSTTGDFPSKELM